MQKDGFILSLAWQTELEDTPQPAMGESSLGLTVLLQMET